MFWGLAPFFVRGRLAWLRHSLIIRLLALAAPRGIITKRRAGTVRLSFAHRKVPGVAFAERGDLCRFARNVNVSGQSHPQATHPIHRRAGMLLSSSLVR